MIWFGIPPTELAIVGFPFPQSFGNGQSEAFLQRFLHDDG